MSGSEHPGMIKPGMVNINGFKLINDIELSELNRHGLTTEQILNKYPNVTHFQIVDWIKGSVGDVNNKPRNIHFIDNDGNGFTLLSRTYLTKWCVSKINEYVNYNEAGYISFLD